MKIAWYYRLVRLTARIMFILTRVTVSGKENLPPTGAFLVCANHVSSADPPLLGLNLPRYPVYFLAKKELFKSSFFGGILKGSGAIPLNREGVSGSSLKLAAGVTKKGGVLIIFPEGKRNPHGRMSVALPGAGYMAAAFKVPVIPVAIIGTETIKGHWWFLKPHQVRIIIGKPFRLIEDDDKPDKKDLEQYGERIMGAIAELLPPERHGVHGKKQ